MSKVIHIRDVPEDVHAALTSAAAASGRSLTAYVKEELEQAARRSKLAESNAEVFRETAKRITTRATKEEIVRALHAGRDE
jgi:plasmid stability protein